MARPSASMYLHPWDVVDEGPRTVLERISATGVTAVNLAVSYHSGRYILQHNPKRKVYFAEEGVVYFEPDPKYYRKTLLKPRRSVEYGSIDILDLVLKESRDFKMKVNAWTVTFHNSAFGHAHPELVIVDAFDGRNYNYLCPNNPEARRYHSALIRNLADYGLNAIMLESSCFPASLQHGDHHEMFGTQIEPLPSELMTVCFCEHCVKRAKKSGFDLLKSKKLVRDVVETSFDLPANVLRATPFSESLRTSYVLSTDMEEIRAIQDFQRDVVNEVFSEARTTIRDSGSKTKLNVIAFGGFSGEYTFGRGSEGINLRELAEIVDGIDLITYVTEPDLAYYLVKWSKFEVGSCPIYAAFRPSYPTLFSAEGVAAEVRNALDAGATGVAFYNYGWTPLRNFEWIRNALRDATSIS